MSYGLIGKVLVACALVSAGLVAGRASMLRPKFIAVEMDVHGQMVLVKESEPRPGGIYVGVPSANYATIGGADGGPSTGPKSTPYIVCEPQDCNPPDGVNFPPGRFVQVGIDNKYKGAGHAVTLHVAPAHGQ